MSTFSLHAQLAADTRVVGDLPLSRVLLMDDARFPWLVLVPRRAALVEFLDLDPDDALALAAEARSCALALRRLYRPDKLNVAALGNVVAQFHLHVVARFRSDARWPQTVWGAPPSVPYTEAQATARLAELRGELQVEAP